MLVSARLGPRPRTLAPSPSIPLRLAAVAICMVMAGVAHADRGAWTPIGSLMELNRVAVHMALVPGDGVNYHSKAEGMRLALERLEGPIALAPAMAGRT